MGIYFCRRNIRAVRIGLLAELQKAFALQGSDSKTIPSLEVMKHKYQDNNKAEESKTEPVSGWQAFIGIFPVTLYIFLTTGCFFISLDCFWSLYKITNNKLEETVYFSQLIFSFTFLGSFLWTLQYLLRRVANFDLSPVSYFRAFFRIVLSLVIVGTIYYSNVLPEFSPVVTAQKVSPAAPAVMPGTAAPDRVPTFLLVAEPAGEEDAPSAGSAKDKGTAEKNTGRATLMIIAVALLVGLFPLAFIDVLVARFPHLALRRVDDDDKRLMKEYPLDMIIGIDPYMKFRLEEFEIGDVQNLATANPIQLFIETPYGLYEVIDWIAQAQLIIAVGSKKTFRLRKYNIRTVFDLEQIGSSEGLRTEIYRILLDDEKIEMKKKAALPDNQALPAVAEKKEANKPQDDLDDVIALLINDLYIKRLRQLWVLIEKKLDVSGPENPVPVDKKEAEEEQAP